MNNKKIIYKNCFQKKHIDQKLNIKFNKICSDTIEKIHSNLDYSKDNFHSLSNKFVFDFKKEDLNKYKKFKTIIIVGMGGSILGAEAIYDFLKIKIKKELIFFNNIDVNKLQKIKNKKNFNKKLFIIISKSGSTIETLSNFFALKIIKKNSKNIIIVSEKKNNPLYSIAKQMNLFHIEHKAYIGGRFSVLSEVGLVPAYLMGLNINNFRKNFLEHFKFKKKIFLKNSIINLASMLKKNIFRNIIFFNYVPELEKFLYWNQQLIAESIGKKGKGFLPVVSMAPKDHHSLLQLYLEGPKDKIFYIFSKKLSSSSKIIS